MREINACDEKAIQDNYRAFLAQHPDLQFEQKKSHPSQAHIVRLVQDMERNAKIAFLEPPSHDNGSNGAFLTWLKRRIQISAQPFLKLLFKRQQRFNDNVVSATYCGLSLEDRILKLELKLSQLQGNARD